MIDGGGEVFGALGVSDRVCSDAVRFPDDSPALNAASGKKHSLDGAPVVASRLFVVAGEQCDFGSASEFTGHDDEGVFEEPGFGEVIEQCGECFVGGWKQAVAEMREGISVGIPGFVIAEIDLHQINTGCDQSASHQEGPAEGVAAVAVLGGFVSAGDIECAADLRVCEK